MKKLSYEISHLDSYDGQHNYELGCYIEEGIIGAVEFVLFDGDMSLTISDIQVRPEYRRKGIGSRMVKVIKDKFPEYKYEPSMKTDLGSKFKHKDIEDLNKFNESMKNFNFKHLIRESLFEVSILTEMYEGETIEEAEYKGKKVELNKPMRGDVKKYKVYVKNDKGNVVKVNFGDKNMEIKRDDPKARKSFRARHNCADKKDKTTAGYWSCKFWSTKSVSDLLGESEDKDNPWAICTASVGREDKEKYEDCVKSVKKQKGITEEENPCWDGYEMVGMKMKDGKEVPNCVPIQKESREDNTYMFWQNLETIKHAVEEMLAMDKETVDKLLADGHGWALDHIATSSDDIEETYHFIEGKMKGKSDE